MKKIHQLIIAIGILLGLASCSDLNKDRYIVATRLVYHSDSEKIWAVITNDTNFMMFSKHNDSIVGLCRCLHFKQDQYLDFKNAFENNTLDWKTLDAEITNEGGGYNWDAFYKEAKTKGVFDIEKRCYLSIPNTITLENARYPIMSLIDEAFSGWEGLTYVEIPNSVTEIGEYAFEDCTGLTSIDIPNSVTKIGRYAFKGCSGMTSISIPNSVTEIGKYAFEDCTGLTSINIPNSVTDIAGAFYGCSGLTSISIPNSVTEIGDFAFWECGNVTSVDIPQNVKNMVSSLAVFDRSIRLVYQLQGTWEWSGYIYGSRTWSRLEITNGQIVFYTTNGILDQGSFSIDWDSHTIRFGRDTYTDFRFDFYNIWNGLTLYFDRKNGDRWRKVSNYTSY